MKYEVKPDNHATMTFDTNEADELAAVRIALHSELEALERGKFTDSKYYRALALVIAKLDAD